MTMVTGDGFTRFAKTLLYHTEDGLRFSIVADNPNDIEMIKNYWRRFALSKCEATFGNQEVTLVFPRQISGDETPA